MKHSGSEWAVGIQAEVAGGMGGPETCCRLRSRLWNSGLVILLSLLICDWSFSSASSSVNEGKTVHPRARLVPPAPVAGDRADGTVAVQSVVHGGIRAP